MPTIDYLVVVALDEEFRSALDVLSEELAIDLPLRPDGPLVVGRAAIPFVQGERRHDELLMAICAGRMGHSAIAAMLPNVLARYNPRDIVLIGLSGSFDPKDLLLGDVLAPMKVFGYEEQKVLQVGRKDVWTFRKLGDRVTSHARAEVRTVVDDPTLYRGDRTLYRAWQDACRGQAGSGSGLSARLDGKSAHEAPVIHVHHNDSLGSGNVVVASARFAKQLRDQVDSTIRAVEMEAGGMFEALDNVDWPGRVLVLRGISDFADSKKSALEQGFKDGWRAYAMRNAVRLAALLIRQRPVWDESRQGVSPPYALCLEPSEESYVRCAEMRIENAAAGARNLAFLPLLRREGGTPGFRIAIAVAGTAPEMASVRMALREIHDPYTTTLHDMRPDGRIAFSRAATDRPFSLELFLSYTSDRVRLTVSLADEFGRTAEGHFPQ